MSGLWVATDLSPASTVAVAAALQWAQRTGDEVVLLHVVHDPVLAPALGNDVPGDLAKAREVLAKFAAAQAAGRPCRIDVRAADDVAAEIVRAAAEAAYLFVGSHGHSGWQRLRLGSIAMAVLRQSRVPVVCVPSPRT